MDKIQGYFKTESCYSTKHEASAQLDPLQYEIKYDMDPFWILSKGVYFLEGSCHNI